MIRTGPTGRSGLRALMPALLVFLSLSFFPAPLIAQTGGARVSGRVTDASGAAVAGAVIAVVVADRPVATTTSGADGRYDVVVPGRAAFLLTVRHEGFADDAVEMPGLTGPVTRDVVLQIGRLSDALIVTASRGAESRARVTQAVTVVTAEDAQALGSRSVGDLLAVVPGVSVESNGREGALTGLFSRGGESDYNLVLIDGVRVNQSGGAFDVSRIAAAEIERVEVVRGAQSALYGSDAMGAVIQIITRRAAPNAAPLFSGSLEAGSFASVRGDAHVTGGARGRVDYAAGVTARRTAGAFGDILPEDDRFEQAVFNGALGAALGPRATLRTGLRHSHAQGRSVGQIRYGVRNTGGSSESTDLSWHLALNHAARRYTGSATVNYFRSEAVSADRGGDPTVRVFAVLAGTPGAQFPESPRLVRLVDAREYATLAANPAVLAPGQFLATTPFGIGDFPFAAETQFRRPAFKYQGDLMWGGMQRLSAGYEWERESDELRVGEELTNHAVFVQQQLNVGDRWFVTVGGRIDDKSMYETFFSPKLSAGGYLVPLTSGAVSSVKVFGNVGKGIKSPTFAERFGGTFADPSPGLKVERARAIDAGVDATFAGGRLRTTATVFSNHYRDQLEFHSTSPFFAPDGRPDFVNIAGSNARGVELEAALQRPFAGITASASYALVDTEVIETAQTGTQFVPGQPLIRRPKHAGTVRLSYAARRVSLHWDTRIVGQRHDATFLGFVSASGVATDVTVNPGYVVSGLGAVFHAHTRASIFIRADNVADEDYDTALGYPGAPRSATVGVRVNVGR